MKDSASPIEISGFTPAQLLVLHARVLDELRNRGITRSANNPTGDLAEHVFCQAFGWKQSNKSKAHIDAVGSDGAKYQIKGRRMTRRNGSRQLGVIRDLVGAHFDFLAAVLFSEGFGIVRAAIIPCSVIAERAKFVKRTNSHRFLLRDDVWDAPDVQDVTQKLEEFWTTLTTMGDGKQM
jgi:hypothetical protein